MRSAWRGPVWLPGVVFVCAVCVLTPAGPAAAGQATPKGKTTTGQAAQAAGQAAGYVGDSTCQTCHDAEFKTYHETPHGRAANPRSPAATTHGCETCHGPGKAHVDGGGDKTKIRSFASLTAIQAAETCTTCHNRGEHTYWQGSTHERHNVSCTTCHSIHNFKSAVAQLKTANELETCAQCHKPEVQKTRQISHMPLVEGKMTCSSCHNPHGSSNVRNLRAGNSIAEACTSCHAAQRGPFLWEHAPVRETCTTCHDPHGSSNDRMLVAKLPMLCQRCHVSTRHPSQMYDLNVLKGSSGNRAYGRGCVNCHQAIHGSNHPGGVHFLR